MDLRTLTTITALLLSLVQSVLSVYCYSCMSMRTRSNSSYNVPDRPDAACESNRNLTDITECQMGGCMIMNTTFKYNFDLYGEVYTRFFIRSCGYEMDKCLDDQDLQPFIGEYEKDINADVENGTFLGFKGTVCFCTGPACNTGNALSPSPVPLIAVGVVLLLCQAITWRP
eukprot:XP_011672194.1 PREDICTED: uncharacterized protein LOC105442087 [Strongylocentrotus purpuratus]